MPEAAAQAESEAPVPTSINFFEEATALKEQLIAWRRDIHQMPEIGLETPNTSAYIQSELTKLDIPFHTIINGSGVVGTIGEDEPCLMLRSDIDGLPMAEESGEEFASTNGNMHACGHDMHAATLLGAAHILKAHESELKGTVKLFFQPGEEGYNGSDEAIAEGVLENPHVDRAFAMHVVSTVPTGVIVYGERPMAAAYNWKIVVEGVAGHGSMPDSCVDPITAAAHIHIGLQEILAREISPMSELVITCGAFNAGDAGNAIPQSATMQGTIRVFDKKTEELAKKRITEIASGIAQTYRCAATTTFGRPSPAVFNDKEFMEQCVEYTKQTLPQAQLYGGAHGMGSEDFGSISQACTANYMMIGAAAGPLNECYGQHNPHVRFDENALPMSSALYASVAMNWLDDNTK